jgi:23S rRNA pseudouridine2605 synthase
MLAAVGHPVIRLHRSRYAGLTLEGLEPGAWRELEPSERERLRSSRPAPRPGRSAPAPARSRSGPGGC